MKKFAMIFAFLGLTFASLPQSFASPASIAATTKMLLKDSKINTSIHTVLKQAYGTNYQPSEQCYKFNQDDTPFCIAIVSVQKRMINNQTYLFVMTNGDSLNELKGHVSGGMSGLFVFKHIANSWKIVAQNANISNGQWGEAQLPNFDLVKVAQDKYGWAGRMDGSGTGEFSTDWVLYMPVGSDVVETVSERVSDSYSGGHWTESEGEVTILTNRPEIHGYYPIRVTRTTKTAPTKANGEPIKSKIKIKNENYVLVFDGKKFVKK